MLLSKDEYKNVHDTHKNISGTIKRKKTIHKNKVEKLIRQANCEIVVLKRKKLSNENFKFRFSGYNSRTSHSNILRYMYFYNWFVIIFYQ